MTLAKAVYDTKDAAKILFGSDDPKSRRKVRRMVINGILECYRRPSECSLQRSSIYISKKVLEKFLDER